MTKFNFSQREQRIFFICILLIVVFALYQGAYKPLQERSEVVNKKIRVAEKRLVKNAQIVRKSENFEKKYKSVLEEFKQTEDDEKVMSSILVEVEKVAGEIDMRIADMKPKRVKSIDFYNQFSVSMTVDGQIEKVMHFLYKLQNPPHLFYVDEVKFNKNSPRDTAVRCILVLSRVLIP